MLTFKQYQKLDLQERFINLLQGDEDRKNQHAAEVHSMLQKAYSKIGGIHGSGFSSPEEMVKKIPMWKMFKHEGQIKAVKLYKDKEGRKSVAVATDGSPEGKAGLSMMMRDDATQKRSYGEMSDKALSTFKKSTGGDLRKHVIPVHRAAKLAGEELRKPPADDPDVARHPEVAQHFYQRKIGGEWHTKLMVGTPHNSITPR